MRSIIFILTLALITRVAPIRNCNRTSPSCSRFRSPVGASPYNRRDRFDDALNILRLRHPRSPGRASDGIRREAGGNSAESHKGGASVISGVFREIRSKPSTGSIRWPIVNQPPSLRRNTPPRRASIIRLTALRFSSRALSSPPVFCSTFSIVNAEHFPPESRTFFINCRASCP